MHARVGHHLRLEEELLAAVAVIRLEHDGVGDLRRQSNLKWVLVHAKMLLAAMEIGESVLNIDECFGKARGVTELGRLWEVASAETNQIERDIDGLEVLLKVDLEAATERLTKLMSSLHVVEFDHHAAVGKDFKLR